MDRRTRAGDVLATEEPHVRPWSTAIRVETSEGVVWFKASTDAHRHEGAAMELLDATPLALALLAVGVPDRRLDVLPDQFDRMLERGLALG